MTTMFSLLLLCINIEAIQCTSYIMCFVYRFVQYGSKTAWHYMEKNDVDVKSIEKFKHLEQSLAAFRKC